MKNEKMLLMSYVGNGLVLDEDERDCLSFLSLYSEDDINQYILRYTVLSSDGEPVFIPGTDFSAIKRDILFDKEVQSLVVSSFSVLRMDIEKRIRFLKMKDGMYDAYLEKKTLEDIWYDYNTFYPHNLREDLSARYGIDDETFSRELETISYAYERARENRKLIDHVFLDGEDEENSFMKMNMIASVLLSGENLMNYSMHPLKSRAFESLLSLMTEYDITPSRVGLD